MARQMEQLVFGGGVDRSTGALSVDSESFYDLRNVYLREGKAESRRGLYETLTFYADEQPFHVAPIRSDGLGVILTYKESTGEIHLYRVNGAGTSTVYIGVLWTLPATSAFPRVTSADSYGKLYLAHDEQVYASRQKSKVYNPATDAITDYEQDLYSSTVGVVDTYFRGFARHLNYLVGWGYGTENAGAEDRPEILRISLPGEPDTMKPLHYAIVGQRNEPILGVATVGRNLVIRKESDSHVLVGESNANFGVQPIDELYGVVAARLMITVGAINYFWSLQGPRASGVSKSDDLSELLDLAGPVPDALVTATAQEYGFAVYDAIEREALFVFGQWAYVLHLRNPSEPRWSFRRYGVALAGGGMLYSGVSGPVSGGSPSGGGGGGGAGGAAAPEAYADITSLVAIGNAGATVNWTNIGTLVGGELAEIWSRLGGGYWVLSKDNVAVAGASESEAISGLYPGLINEIAVRFKLVGVYGPSYTSSDPSLWPAVSRDTITLGAALTPPGSVAASGYCDGSSARIGWTFTVTSGDRTRVERSEDGGATWTAITLQSNPTAAGDVGIDFDIYYFMRFRHEDTAGTSVSAWATVEVGSMPAGVCG